MVATRGRPEKVTSDNGTNFLGTEGSSENLLKQWTKNESLVKVGKKSLNAVTGNAGLTDDELQTAKH